MDKPTEKPCSKCKRVLPLSEFPPDRRMILGVGSQCRKCNSERMKKAGNTPESKAKRSEYNRKYREKNRERLLEANRKWWRDNKEHITKYQKKNRKRINKRMREYRQKNPEKFRRLTRSWYLRNKTRQRDYNRKWRAENPEKFMASLKKRRAMKCGAREANLTAAEWRERKKEFGNRCAYCGRKMERLTQDHFIPLCKGGPHNRENVVPACLKCNCEKWANLRDVLPEFSHLVGNNEQQNT